MRFMKTRTIFMRGRMKHYVRNAQKACNISKTTVRKFSFRKDIFYDVFEQYSNHIPIKLNLVKIQSISSGNHQNNFKNSFLEKLPG